MKELRDEIYDIKENIYSANIEKRKLNEKLYTLNENLKKVNLGYNEYKTLSDKVDHIKTLKDVKEFKNVSLKNKIIAKRNNVVKKDINYKSEETTPTPEYLATMELKEDYNKLHYNDKMTLEDKKNYLFSEYKDFANRSVSNTNITLFATLNDDIKYEIDNGDIKTMLVAYSTLDEAKENATKDSDLLVIELKKNSHYIPVLTNKGSVCALIGGNVSVTYKENINTGSKNVNIWHIKK